MVEFAHETSIVHVSYSTKLVHSPPKFDHKIAVTPLTKAINQSMSGKPADTHYGHLHFDIGNDHRRRAEFAVDYIKNRTKLVNDLIPLPSSYKYYRGGFNVHKRYTQADNKPPIGSNTKIEVKAGIVTYPTIVVESIVDSNAANSAGHVCVDIVINANDEISDLILKKY